MLSTDIITRLNNNSKVKTLHEEYGSQKQYLLISGDVQISLSVQKFRHN